jgi:hypothetical protein
MIHIRKMHIVAFAGTIASKQTLAMSWKLYKRSPGEEITSWPVVNCQRG